MANTPNTLEEPLPLPLDWYATEENTRSKMMESELIESRKRIGKAIPSLLRAVKMLEALKEKAIGNDWIFSIGAQENVLNGICSLLGTEETPSRKLEIK